MTHEVFYVGKGIGDAFGSMEQRRSSSAKARLLRKPAKSWPVFARSKEAGHQPEVELPGSKSRQKIRRALGPSKVCMTSGRPVPALAIASQLALVTALNGMALSFGVVRRTRLSTWSASFDPANSGVMVRFLRRFAFLTKRSTNSFSSALPVSVLDLISCAAMSPRKSRSRRASPVYIHRRALHREHAGRQFSTVSGPPF